MGTETKQKPKLGGTLSREGAAVMCEGQVVALATNDEKVADEMVRRCNAHDDLLAAAKMATKRKGDYLGALDAAIAKAEAEGE